jgi:hypothetical protein
MTRLHQALERARLLEAESAPRPFREHLASSETTPTIASSSEISHVNAGDLVCTSCGTPHTGFRGLRWLIALIRIPLFRCGFCRRRSSRLGAAHPQTQGWGAAFLPPTDQRTFQDVIREMARDEQQEARQRARPDASNAGLERDPGSRPVQHGPTVIYPTRPRS